MFLVGIAGGSGSGKTTFAQKILHRVKNPGLAILHQDSYYLPKLPDHLSVHGEPNFDHPEAFDWDLLRTQLTDIKLGKSVQTPRYDYKGHGRSAETDTVGPCQALLFEGIYSLWEPELRGLFDLKVFLHVEADIRFIRRLHRDVRERGRTLDSIIRQYYDTVRPMHHEFLEPTEAYADIVVGEENDIAADVISARITQILEGQSSEGQRFEK